MDPEKTKITSEKKQRDDIRLNIRKKRNELSLQALQTAAKLLLQNCIPSLENVSSVAGYQSMQGEMNLDPVFEHCHQHNIMTLLPIMRGQSLMFAPFTAASTFTVKQYGIKEPDTPQSEWLSPDQLNLVLVPLVAFDNTCNRIGMGGGFYDRSFEFRKNKKTPPTLIGVAHQLQQVEDVLPQPWDVALDGIITDKKIITAKKV